MKRWVDFTLISRRSFNPTLNLSCTFSLSAPEPDQPQIKLQHVDLIHSFLGGDRERIKKLLTENMRLQLFDNKTMLKKLKIIQGMRLADQNSTKIIPLLNYHSRGLQNRYEVLREFGVIPYKISSSTIRKYVSLCKSSALKLKHKELIKTDHKVIRNLWEAAGLNLATCPEESDNARLYDLKIVAVKAFLKEKLDMPDKYISLYESEIIKRLKNKSFNNMNTNLHIFQKIIGLSKKRLPGNWLILSCDPMNIYDLLNRVREVAQVDMKIILHITPKIAFMTSENLENIVEHFKAVNIPIDYVLRRLDLLTLSCETVLSRLQELKNVEYFSLHIKNPRIVDLVHSQVKAKKRLTILEELNMYPTINSLVNHEGHFESFCERGARKFSSETLQYVTAELDIGKEEFINKIKRHHRWIHVPIIHVGRNLQKLRHQFSDEEIKNNIYILFYFSERLNKELEQLESREDLEQYKENGLLKKEYILPLVLYFLEKESNFTGESIWSTEDINPYQDLPDLPKGINKC